MNYKLNDNDLLELYGITVNDGSSSFLAFPKRKDSLKNNWQDENGIDIDLISPKFEAREFVIKCTLEASTQIDFWNKYNGLFTELSISGTHELFVPDLDKIYTVFYVEQQNVKKVTRINSEYPVGVQFDLVFGEVDPTVNIEAVYLVDSSDRFLIA